MVTTFAFGFPFDTRGKRGKRRKKKRRKGFSIPAFFVSRRVLGDNVVLLLSGFSLPRSFIRPYFFRYSVTERNCRITGDAGRIDQISDFPLV